MNTSNLTKIGAENVASAFRQYWSQQIRNLH